MATVNQIYQLVNDSAAEALGAQAISVKNTSTLVSLGDVVLSSADNKDAFYSALVDRIGRTAIAIRQYRAQTRSVRKRRDGVGSCISEDLLQESQCNN